MRKLSKLVAGLMAGFTLVALMAPTGGFPSRPKFQNVTATDSSQNMYLAQGTLAGGMNGLKVNNTSANAAAFSNIIIQNNAVHRLDFGMTSSGFSGAVMTGGISGESAFINTVSGGNGLCIATGGTARLCFSNTGAASGSFTSTGSYTATVTGCTTSPTATVFYSVVGRIVTMTMPTTSCTSNSTSWGFTGVPAAIRPATNNLAGVSRIACTNNSVAEFGTCGILVDTSGVITMTRNGNTAGFTASGTKGVGEFSNHTYSLD
jgi:hypothetical protein